MGVFKVDVSDLAKVVGSLGLITKDASGTMEVAAEMLVTEVGDRWESAGDGQWPSLAPSTLAKRRGTTAQILIDTGAARNSTFAESGADFAEAANPTSYMAFHCGDGPRKKIPLRDPFSLGEEALARVVDFIEEDLVARWQQG